MQFLETVDAIDLRDCYGNLTDHPIWGSGMAHPIVNVSGVG